MKPFDDLTGPSFYAQLYATQRESLDQTLYSEALATLVAAATMRPGFLGFVTDFDAKGDPVKIVYWESYGALRAWLNSASDLLPDPIIMSDCLIGTGCHWSWLDRSNSDKFLPKRAIS